MHEEGDNLDAGGTPVNTEGDAPPTMMVWYLLPEGRLVRVELQQAVGVTTGDLAYLNRMIDFAPVYLSLTQEARTAVVDRMRVDASPQTFAAVHAYWTGWIHCARGMRVQAYETFAAGRGGRF